MDGKQLQILEKIGKNVLKFDDNRDKVSIKVKTLLLVITTAILVTATVANPSFGLVLLSCMTSTASVGGALKINEAKERELKEIKDFCQSFCREHFPNITKSTQQTIGK